MWTIRQEQADAFTQYHLQKFEDEMVKHLTRFASKQWKVMGEPDGRDVIRLGIERAGKYGFQNRGPVRFYIELMFMFGSYFDTDAQYPWASAVLADIQQRDQMARADKLFSALHDYLHLVSGPDNEYELAALRRLSKVRLDECVGEPRPVEWIFWKFREVYPEKCNYLGDVLIRHLIQCGVDTANAFKLTSETGSAVVSGLIFCLGHRFSEDKLHNWINTRLSDPKWTDPNDRAKGLYSRAMAYLNHVLAERERIGNVP